MDAITKAYLTCALWSSSDDNDEPFDSSYGINHIAPEDVMEAEKDCRNFCEENKALLEKSGLDETRIGHDFWLTRNGHGAGFWDRDLGETGDKLTEACEAYGEAGLYLGDDGLIYIYRG